MTLLIENRRARFEYEMFDVVEAGIVLVGTEVKSIRNGQCNISDGYIEIKGNVARLMNVHISQYKHAYKNLNHEPMRHRILLMKKSEMDKLYGKVKIKGFTLVPLNMHITRGSIKVDIALCKGKQLHDKRKDQKEKDIAKSMRIERGDD
jgi:SsrA-binding protein